MSASISVSIWRCRSEESRSLWARVTIVWKKKKERFIKELCRNNKGGKQKSSWKNERKEFENEE